MVVQVPAADPRYTSGVCGRRVLRPCDDLRTNAGWAGAIRDRPLRVHVHVPHVTTVVGCNMLSVEGLQVTYGGAVRALRGVPRGVPDGAAAAVRGSNGAGKPPRLRTVPGPLGLPGGGVGAGSGGLGAVELPRRDAARIVRAGVVQ